MGKRATSKCIQNMDIDLGIEIDKGFLYVLRRAKASRTKQPTQKPRVLKRQLIDQVAGSYAEKGR